LVAACAEKHAIKSALSLYVSRYAIVGIVSLGRAVR